MSYIFSFFNNDIATSVFWILWILFFSYAFGKIIQKKTKIFLDSNFLSPVIGFFAYFVIVLTLFSFVGIFNANINTYSIILITIDIISLIFILSFWRIWLPKRINKITYSSILRTLLLFGVISSIGFIICYLTNSFSWFNEVNESTELYKTIENGLNRTTLQFKLSSNNKNTLENAYYGNQSYYFFAAGQINLLGINQTMFFQYLIPLVVNLLMTFMVMGIIKLYFEKATYLLFSPLISIGLIFLTSIFSPLYGSYFLWLVLGFISVLIFQESKYKKNDNPILIFSMLTATIPFFLADAGLMLFVLIGISILVYSLTIPNKFFDVLITFISLSFYLLILFTYRFNYTAMLWTSFIGIAAIVMIVWLRLTHRININGNFIFKKEVILLTILASVFVSLMCFFLTPFYNVETLGNFFTSQFIFTTNTTLNITINVLFISMIYIGPVLFGIIYFLREKENERYYGYIGIFAILFFNPFSYIWINNVFFVNHQMGYISAFMIFPLILFTTTQFEKISLLIGKKVFKKYN